MKLWHKLFRSPRKTLTRASARLRGELLRIDAMEAELKSYRKSVEEQLRATENQLFALSTGNPGRIFHAIDYGRQHGDCSAFVTVRLDDDGKLRVVNVETVDKEPGTETS